ncbi:MAG: EAL domain-containing protein [Halobacteria archaeon]|nr:EAL domain-containing protein [Halobacteria archaeon]
MKLRTKIPVFLVPLIILSMLLLGWFAYMKLREASEQRVFGEMQASLDHLREHVAAEIESARGNIELLSRQTLVRKYILTDDEEERYTLLQPALMRLLSAYQEAFPEFYEIRVFLPDGYEDARQTRPFIENYSDEEGDSALFRAMQSAGDNIYTAVYRNPDNGKISLFFGKPLVLINRAVDAVGSTPRLRGYIGLTVDLGEVESHIHKETISQSGYLFATDPTGYVLFESSRRPVRDATPGTLIDTVMNSKAATRPILQDFNDERAFLAGMRLHDDLFAHAVLPESELRAISYQLGVIVAAITLVTIIVTTLFMMLAMEFQVIRPIHSLRRLSKEIGRGNLSVKVSGMNSDDEIGELATAFEEMAGSLQRSDEQVRFLAYHDSLTGLPNRAMFKEYLDRSIAHAKRNEEIVGVLFLDVDNFKNVNDTLGHHAGDALLQEVAERITDVLRGDDYIARGHGKDTPDKVLARLGGDEFIILLPAIQDSLAPGLVAQRLVEVLAKPIRLFGQECHVSASIGITVFPTDGGDSDTLIKNADIAMYHAKEKGKNAYQYFENAMNVAAVERVELEGRLRRALEQGHLELFYQPQVHGVTREVVGIEALLRWRDPDDGLISPAEFIPLAETSGLILPIGEWVMHQACMQARAWQKAGYPMRMMCVNVSSVQFARQDVAAIVHAALEKSRLSPACLEIEITESVIMSDPDTAIEMLRDIKALGVGIALDDFGTGYSSLSYLRRFPIDTLKIDRAFVREIDVKTEDAEIVGAITALAHTLGLRVVVEGIETESQLGIVISRQCDVIQGFLFSRPLPADELVHLLAERNLRIA